MVYFNIFENKIEMGKAAAEKVAEIFNEILKKRLENKLEVLKDDLVRLKTQQSVLAEKIANLQIGKVESKEIR